MKFTALNTLPLLALLLTPHLGAETRFITDEFKVTLRTGMGTSNSILTMLKSGESVNFIEEDEATKYSLVETKNGKKGYILSRFLDNQPSGRALYKNLQAKSKKQSTIILSLKANLKDTKQSKRQIEAEAKMLNSELSNTTNELSTLKSATTDTVAVIKENKSQQHLIEQLKNEKAQLLAENNRYKDSSAMDWFITGSSVSLLAFLIGIIVTRIKWRKQDSWGDF